MDSTEPQPPALRRCPKCHCVQPQPPHGACRACGWSAPPGRWEEETTRHPVQPEERDANRCPECAGAVTVRMPLRRPIQSPLFQPIQSPLFLWSAFGVVFLVLAVSVGAPWATLLWITSPAIIMLPLHLLYRRYGGAASLKTIVVLCPACGFLRIGGRTVETVTVPFRRGARLFNAIYRRLLPVCGFFLVLTVGAMITGTTPTGFNIGFLVVSGFAFHATRWYRAVFGLRGWW